MVAMERKQLSLLGMTTLLCGAVLLCSVVSGFVLWRFFPQEAQSPLVPLEKILPNGHVAGVSTEPSATPTFTPTLAPTSVSQPIQSHPSYSVSAITPVVTPTSVPVVGLQNGDFSENMRHWEQRGAVAVLELQISDRPEDFDGIDHFVRLASSTNLEWLGAHALQQTFRVPLQHHALEFWYRIHTQETALGFDSPCLVVTVNDQAVAWFSAAAASETWQRHAVPLPMTTDGLVTIGFLVGQTGDQIQASWVDLTNIYTLPAVPYQPVSAPVFPDTQLRLSFTNSAEIGLSLDAVTPVYPLQFTQKLTSELLLPEIAFQQSLHQLAWKPDGTGFEPEIVAPDFFGTQASLYEPASQNPWNLPVQLNQLKDHYHTLPVKLWLVVKTAVDEVTALLPVNY